MATIAAEVNIPMFSKVLPNATSACAHPACVLKLSTHPWVDSPASGRDQFQNLGNGEFEIWNLKI